jgi:hypothetical protein
MRVATTHHKSSGVQDAESLRIALEQFIGEAKAPAALDYGDLPMAISAGHYSIEIRSGRLLFEVWDEKRTLARRIVSLEGRQPGLLECRAQRFGGATASFRFLDLEHPKAARRAQRAGRQSFAEQFRGMLQRQLPAWEIKTLTAALDLRRSFSATFPRAHLQYRSEHIAALACPDLASETGLLTSALLWFDYLRHRIRPGERLSLYLFLPEEAGTLAAHRLRWLNTGLLRPHVFRFNDDGMAGEVDPRDLGNIETRVSSIYAPAELSPEIKALLTRLGGQPGIACCPEIDGAISIRFQGLEFARIKGIRAWLGIDKPEEIRISELERIATFATHLRSLRPNRASELPRFPEKHFEGAVRRNLLAFDADLLESPVHGQVLTFAGGVREALDLLAVSRSGQLCILELKIAEDIELPTQALDYWARIGWHLERGELDALFPGRVLARLAPKLMLVAPALSFHPANEIVLRYFPAEIPVERIGVNSDWETGLRVVLRLKGAEQPISHRIWNKESNDHRWTGQHQEGDRHTEST